MDRQYLKTPFYGSRKMKAWLLQQGYAGCSLKKGSKADAVDGSGSHLPASQHQQTSRPGIDRIFPYLLKSSRRVNRVDQVWAADITYIPMAKGFTVPGGHHGLAQPVHVLAWKLSQHHGHQLLRGGVGGSPG